VGFFTGLTQPGACHLKNPVKTPGLTLFHEITEKACQKFVRGVGITISNGIGWKLVAKTNKKTLKNLELN
jgi:hypothetical protein